MSATLPILQTGLVTLLDTSLALGIASGLELIMPDPDDSKSSLVIFGEAAAQVAAATVFALESRQILAPLYNNDPTGGSALTGMLYFSQPNLFKKLGILRSRLVEYTSAFMSTPAPSDSS